MFRFLSEPSQSLCWFSWKKLDVPPSRLYWTLLSHQPKNSKSSQGSFRLGVGRSMIGSQSAIESLPSDTRGISPDYHQQPTIGPGSGENVEPSFAIHLWSWVKGFAGIEERIRRNQETDERIRG